VGGVPKIGESEEEKAGLGESPSSDGSGEAEDGNQIAPGGLTTADCSYRCRAGGLALS
jgi:hypothetical protein